MSWDLIFGVIRYGVVLWAGGFLWHITQMEERAEDAWDAGFLAGQVYHGDSVRSR